LKFAEDLGVQNFEQDPLLLLVAWKLEGLREKKTNMNELKTNMNELKINMNKIKKKKIVNQQHVWEISKEEFLNWNKFGYYKKKNINKQKKNKHKHNFFI